MLVSVPLQAFAQVNFDDLTKDKPEIINKDDPPLKVAKPDKGKGRHRI